MNLTGIITEYNPFHHGHLHHLKSAKKDFGKAFSTEGVKCNLFSYSRGNSAFIFAVFNNAAVVLYVENAKGGDSAKLCY